MSAPIPEHLRVGSGRGLEELTERDHEKTPEEWLAAYHSALKHMPASGGGGAHVALLPAAYKGRRAGLAKAQIKVDLWRVTRNHGTRKVTDTEINGAIERAFSTDRPKRVTPLRKIDGPGEFAKICARGRGATVADLWDASPVRPAWPPAQHAVELLERCYLPGERLFIGREYDRGPVLTAREWVEKFRRGWPVPEFVIPNSLSGAPGVAKNGKPSLRCDASVVDHAVAVVEFDGIPLATQVEFFAGLPLDIVALIYSGKKSIHGWISVNIHDAEEWQARVAEQLFDELTAMGVDRSCKNASRLSRMPGHLRAETGRWQRLLYLDPDGSPIRRGR
jgi:hypothetical protein